MTTIAWDGKTLAADKMTYIDGLKIPCTKIRQLETGEVVSGAGRVDQTMTLIRWYESGADPAAYPSFQTNEEKNTNFVVAKNGKVFCYQTTPDPCPYEGPMAWGSGRDFAISAMALGKSAVEAVLFASQFDSHSGFGVDSFDAAEGAE